MSGNAPWGPEVQMKYTSSPRGERVGSLSEHHLRRSLGIGRRLHPLSRPATLLRCPPCCKPGCLLHSQSLSSARIQLKNNATEKLGLRRTEAVVTFRHVIIAAYLCDRLSFPALCRGSGVCCHHATSARYSVFIAGFACLSVSIPLYDQCVSYGCLSLGALPFQ